MGPGRARAGPGPKDQDRISLLFGRKPIQILQLPASQPLEAALAADCAPKKGKSFVRAVPPSVRKP